jgi:hypothetical protein
MDQANRRRDTDAVEREPGREVLPGLPIALLADLVASITPPNRSPIRTTSAALIAMSVPTPMVMDMAQEFGFEGIHVAYVVTDGQIDTPDIRKRLSDRHDEMFLDPDRMAETYWHLVEQDDVSTTF